MQSTAQRHKFEIHNNILFKLHRLSGIYGQCSALTYQDALQISRPEVRVILTLGTHGPLAPLDVVRLAGMDKALVSRATKSLVKKRKISKKEDRRDRRRLILTLTKSGQRAYQFVLEYAKDRYGQALVALSEEECLLLDNILDRLFETGSKLLDKAAAHTGGNSKPRRQVIE